MGKLVFAFIFLFPVTSTFAAGTISNTWQQEVNYSITVILNDTKHELVAFSDIEYINRSPNDLKEIWFHLWPNAYKNRETAYAQQELRNGNLDFYFSKPEQRGYIDSLDFMVEGRPVHWEYDPAHIDICRLILNEPLKSGGRIHITTPFRVKIPDSFSRLGHKGQAYQVTQWYPKPAVYDASGWHAMPYLDQGEFYSEFGSFDVKVTVPENYIVAATGDLQNPEELAWLNAKADTTAKLTSFPDDLSFPPSAAKTKTLHYMQSNVHDFAWFADKRFHVMKSNVILSGGRQVTSWAFFTNARADLWKKATDYIDHTLVSYSGWIGDYPYNQATAVDGSLQAGGGMEYPTITVIGDASTDRILETVMVHEVGHNWFYGILGTNEREYPWMDEGINSYYERRYFNSRYPSANSLGEGLGVGRSGKALGLNRLASDYQNNLLYLWNARRGLDQAAALPAESYTYFNYGAMVYSKTALLMRYLEEAIGIPAFDKAMHLYFNQWKFRHPQPEDLQSFFNSTSGKNTSWFFNEGLHSTEKIDFKLKSVKQDPDEPYVIVHIENKSSFSAPAFISSFDKQGNLLESKRREPFTGTERLGLNSINAYRVTIDPDFRIPEISHKNNSMRAYGWFRKSRPLRIRPFAEPERPDRTQVFYMPVAGYNYTDKLMPGLALYNSFIPFQNWQYVLVPMYSLENRVLNGTGKLAYSMYPEHIFQRLTLSMHYYGFSYLSMDIARFDASLNTQKKSLRFNKISPKLEIEFRKPDLRSKATHTISFRSVHIIKDELMVTKLNDSSYRQAETQNRYRVNELLYTLDNRRAPDPFSVRLSLQQHAAFIKMGTEWMYSLIYAKKKQADIRLFAGKFIRNRNADPEFNFAFSGNTDYLFDEVYLDRSRLSSSALNRQFVVSDGGFKQLTNSIAASDWMLAVNLRTPFPFKLPLGAYADWGISSADDTRHYIAGFYFSFARNIFEVYFPVRMSDSLDRFTYAEKIRFVLNLRLMNPFDILKNSFI